MKLMTGTQDNFTICQAGDSPHILSRGGSVRWPCLVTGSVPRYDGRYQLRQISTTVGCNEKHNGDSNNHIQVKE